MAKQTMNAIDIYLLMLDKIIFFSAKIFFFC